MTTYSNKINKKKGPTHRFSAEKNGKSRNVLTSLKKMFVNLTAEFKSIRWCSLKSWISSSLVVILFGSVMALCLAGFDYLSTLVVSLISIDGGVLQIMIRTVLQIIIFVDACAVAILCFLQANKGQSVLKGITDTGSSLFSANKEVGADKVITKIISIMTAVLFILTIIEESM